MHLHKNNCLVPSSPCKHLKIPYSPQDTVAIAIPRSKIVANTAHKLLSLCGPCRHCRTFRIVALSTCEWRCDNADAMLTVATATARAAATIAAATMHLAAERCNHLMPHYLAHFNGPKKRKSGRFSR